MFSKLAAGSCPATRTRGSRVRRDEALRTSINMADFWDSHPDGKKDLLRLLTGDAKWLAWPDKESRCCRGLGGSGAQILPPTAAVSRRT